MLQPRRDDGRHQCHRIVVYDDLVDGDVVIVRCRRFRHRECMRFRADNANEQQNERNVLHARVGSPEEELRENRHNENFDLPNYRQRAGVDQFQHDERQVIVDRKQRSRNGVANKRATIQRRQNVP